VWLIQDIPLRTQIFSSKDPDLFFEGPSPNHRFYRKDTDSYLRPKATTNIANTDFGIYYETYSPARTLIDLIKTIKYSLTSEGEKEMDDFMCSR